MSSTSKFFPRLALFFFELQGFSNSEQEPSADIHLNFESMLQYLPHADYKTHPLHHTIQELESAAFRFSNVLDNKIKKVFIPLLFNLNITQFPGIFYVYKNL